MRILFLTQILPYPPDSGPKVKTLHVLRHLAESGHEVTLVTFIRTEELPHVHALEKVCKQIITVPIKRSRLADVAYLIQSNLTGSSFLMLRDNLPGMRETVRKVISTQDIDVIHADQLTMTQFALQGKAEQQKHFPDQMPPHLIFDAHNAVWTIVERMNSNGNPLLKPVLALETGRVKRYEGMLVSTFDYTLTVAEPDRRALLEAVQHYNHRVNIPAAQIPVIPIAVDTKTLQPVERKPGSHNIVTLGTLHYPPNADGIRWFINEVFPLILQKLPSATLTIIGKNPPHDFIQHAERDPEHITVTGYVEDLLPYLQQAAIMAVPVRAGGGMRVRILEAFARAMPVLTTTIGLEGIEAEHPDEVIVEDSAEAAAEAAVWLIQSPQEQEKLARNGRLLAEKKYDWQAVLTRLDQVYQSIAEKRARHA